VVKRLGHKDDVVVGLEEQPHERVLVHRELGNQFASTFEWFFLLVLVRFVKKFF
jgi:hypothetical protein